MRLYDQAKSCMTMNDQFMRRWMLHGNISRNGYGNTMIRRYGGCFEEDILRLVYDGAYHANDVDAPAKFAPSLKMRKSNARYRRGYQNMAGASSKNRIIALVNGTHPLIINKYL